MIFEFNNESPIYLQLVERLRLGIVSGELAPGSRLPSVREVAVQAKINPNTAQRALTQLEEEGLLYTERTNGKFVTPDTERIRWEKERLARESLRRFCRDLGRLSMTPEEIEQLWKERNNGMDEM